MKCILVYDTNSSNAHAQSGILFHAIAPPNLGLHISNEYGAEKDQFFFFDIVRLKAEKGRLNRLFIESIITSIMPEKNIQSTDSGMFTISKLPPKQGE